VIYTVQVAVAYFLMLIAMTYNMGHFLALLFGVGLGYFLFQDLDSAGGSKDNHCG
jgi:hypothetical protein